MTEPGRLRLIELLASLSLATDTVTGQPMGHGIRTCLVATDIAERFGCPTEQVRHVQQVALLRFLGCTAEVSGLSRRVGGDEIAFNRAVAPVLNGGKAETLRAIVPAIAPDSPALRRLGAIARMVTDSEAERVMTRSHCEVAAMLAHRLGLDDAVVKGLRHAFERWDGTGTPDGLAGDEVPLEVGIGAVARDIDIATMTGGDVSTVMKARSGKAYDPSIVSMVLDSRMASHEADWDELLSSEPEPVAMIEDLDPALDVMADFADMKSPWTRGNSRRVADLAARAAAAAGLSPEQVEHLRKAALVHDLGKVGIENGIWEKPGPLSLDEWERVRLHPYMTERIISRCGPLVSLAKTATRHHEQPNGEGYHGRLSSSQLTLSDQILATASAYVAMTSDRPHRPALSSEEAAAVLGAGAAEGAYDPIAIRHVLAAQGIRQSGRAVSNPAGLTDREIEVLRLIVREQTNRQIADALFISPKTVGRHVENIYSKIGVSTRAGATVFAMEHELHS